MTAYELADWLNDPLGYKMGEIANMLRQQADRIAALEKLAEATRKAFMNVSEELAKQTNAEPVAWMVTSKVIVLEPIDGAIPLYTTPQTKPLSDDPLSNFKPVWQEKHQPLSDEEIGQFKAKWYYNEFDSFYELVRAIEERILGK